MFVGVEARLSVGWTMTKLALAADSPDRAVKVTSKVVEASAPTEEGVATTPLTLPDVPME